MSWYDEDPVEPDVEAGLLVYLAPLGYTGTLLPPPDDFRTELAANEGRGAVLHIRRIGGGASRKTDAAQIAVRGFTLASTTVPRSSHRLLGAVTRRIEAINTAGPVDIPDELGGGKLLFDAGEKISGPVQLPWLDDNVLPVECIYRIDVRR